ncbi:hypothetical protein MRX96_042751 [Rhipicephalus microplus]
MPEQPSSHSSYDFAPPTLRCGVAQVTPVGVIGVARRSPRVVKEGVSGDGHRKTATAARSEPYSRTVALVHVPRKRFLWGTFPRSTRTCAFTDKRSVNFKTRVVGPYRLPG